MINYAVNAISETLNVEAQDIKVYDSSYCSVQDAQLLMVAVKGEKYIVVWGNTSPLKAFEGRLLKQDLRLCPLTHHNRLALNEYLDYTMPKAFGRDTATFGTGDRLGLASPGHLKAVSKSSAKPILAQQSRRELELTGRTFKDVLDDASFAVFQEGYKGGFGADGDHLKQEAHIAEALNYGYSMITIDCSEKIGKGIDSLSTEEAEAMYSALPAETRKSLEDKYLGRVFSINGLDIKFTMDELVRNVLIYGEAVNFVVDIYKRHISTCGREIDFEVSIDETESTTTEYGHIFAASEIIDAGVKLNSLAPRFIGEFQKGIDYIGDIAEFERQLALHASIADYFGYKLSIHSGSDKFSVFSLIGKYTKCRLHIKTSGTSWLEAVGTIAECNPALYRAMHKRALEHFGDAKKYYHVTADLSKVVDIDTVTDDYLPEYMKYDDSRQLLHITYGFMLRDPEMKASIYETLRAHEDAYSRRLEKHIGCHLDLAGL